MDYKKKYEKLVDAVKVLRDNNPSDEGIQNWVSDNVPELKESEDEKIRKVLLGFLENELKKHGNEEWDGCIYTTDVIAWLEKQGSQNLANSAKTCKDEQKPKEKTKIYDSMDDLIADALIEEIEGSELDDRGKYNRIHWIESHRQKHPWSEEDETKLTTARTFIRNTSLIGNDGIKEATIDWLNGLKDRVQQHPKQEWSEEDYRIFSMIATDVNLAHDVVRKGGADKERDRELAWLNCLRDQVLPHPKQEWSEEDEHRVKDTIYFLDTAKKHYASTVEIDACVEWLKSLKERYTWNTWKPRKEQLEALDFAADCIVPAEFCIKRKVLKELLKQLKKLQRRAIMALLLSISVTATIPL